MSNDQDNDLDIEQSILQRCVAGDHGAFRELVEQLKGPAYYHALSLLRHPDDREILCLKDMHDYACKDIAFVLSIPLGTVMSRLYTARSRLRNHVQELGYEHS